MDLDVLIFQVRAEAILLVDEPILDNLALVALELDHLAHLIIVDDGAIASCEELVVGPW